MKKKPLPPFESHLTAREIVGGVVMIPFHGLALPMLLTLWSVYAGWITVGISTVMTYGLSFVLVLAIFFPWLRKQYDIMCDRMGSVIWNVIGGLALLYCLSTVVAYLILWLGTDAAANPNNETILSLTGQDMRFTRAMAIFIAPVVEETLFRGVVYGGLWKRSRTLAAAASMLLFALYHVWPYMLAGTPDILLYGIQYLPVAAALCIAYERSGSIWTCIFIHMINNAAAYALLA